MKTATKTSDWLLGELRNKEALIDNYNKLGDLYKLKDSLLYHDIKDRIVGLSQPEKKEEVKTGSEYSGEYLPKVEKQEKKEESSPYWKYCDELDMATHMFGSPRFEEEEWESKLKKLITKRWGEGYIGTYPYNEMYDICKEVVSSFEKEEVIYSPCCICGVRNQIHTVSDQTGIYCSWECYDKRKVKQEPTQELDLKETFTYPELYEMSKIFGIVGNKWLKSKIEKLLKQCILKPIN